MKIVANVKIEMEVSDELLDGELEDEDVMSVMFGDNCKYTITDVTGDDEDMLDEPMDITEQIKEAVLGEKA